MKKLSTILCSVLFFLFLFVQGTFGQEIFSDDFETGVAGGDWISYLDGEESVVVVAMGEAPAALATGGDYVASLIDADTSYTGAAISLAGNVDLVNYSIEGDVYCYANHPGGSAYTGLCVYSDPAAGVYIKLAADFDSDQRFRLYNNKLDINTFQYTFHHAFTAGDVPGGIPTTDGWHHMKVEVRTVSETQTAFWCYFDGELLTGCPIYDNGQHRMASGMFGVYAFQQTTPITGYFDNIVVNQLEATDVGDDAQIIPTDFSLAQNYPNPFNPTTNISYNLQSSGYVSLVVSDILGQHVRTLVSREQNSGQHIAVWDGKDDNGNLVPSGMYIYSLRSGNNFESKKMVLMK